jgi:hypothetical protein
MSQELSSLLSLWPSDGSLYLHYPSSVRARSSTILGRQLHRHLIAWQGGAIPMVIHAQHDESPRHMRHCTVIRFGPMKRLCSPQCGVSLSVNASVSQCLGINQLVQWLAPDRGGDDIDQDGQLRFSTAAPRSLTQLCTSKCQHSAWHGAPSLCRSGSCR